MNHVIHLETYRKIHTLESMCGVMHELTNKTECYDTYLYNIKYYLVIGQDLSILAHLPQFIWETCKGTDWEDVYLELNEESDKYKDWFKRYNRKIKINKILNE
jgi:hypothetical protein